MTKEEKVKSFGEVFTPPELVNEILDKFPKKTWKDETKTWLDPTCGDGVFLVEVKKRLMKGLASKIKDKSKREQWILEKMLYGADIQEDNVRKCIENLYGVKAEDLEHIKECEGYLGKEGLKYLFTTKGGLLIRNVVCADGLKYQYNFGTKGDEGPLLQGTTKDQNKLIL